MVDDNFYYRSMRHRYYLLCQHYSVTFFQIWVQCELSTAIQRNISRDGATHVSADTIQRMHALFEWDKKSIWEKYSSMLNVEAHLDVVGWWEELKVTLKRAHQEQLKMWVICHVKSSQKERERKRIQTDLLHQLHLRLNRTVTEWYKKNHEESRINNTNVMKEVAILKKEFYEQAKQRLYNAPTTETLRVVEESWKTQLATFKFS